MLYGLLKVSMFCIDVNLICFSLQLITKVWLSSVSAVCVTGITKTGETVPVTLASDYMAKALAGLDQAFKQVH